MTEQSRPWPGTAVGDAGPYTAPHWWNVWQSMTGGNGALVGVGNKGVFSCIPNSLLVTYVGPNFLNVAPGAALLDGLYYENDSNYSVTVGSAAAGTVRDDRLVVRKYFANNIQTARLVLLAGTGAAAPGPGTPPALTQDVTRATYWDVPLARVSVADNGVITLTDERQMIYPPGDVVKLYETVIGVGGGVVDWDPIPQEFRHLKIVISGRASDHSVQSNCAIVRFNNDTAAHYSFTYMQLSYDQPLWAKVTGRTGIETVTLPSDGDATTGPGDIGGGEILIPNYRGAGAWNRMLTYHGAHYQATWVDYVWGHGLWLSSAPITSIQIHADSDGDAHPNFAEGTVLSLYGLR